jgi:hypothetical protein
MVMHSQIDSYPSSLSTSLGGVGGSKGELNGRFQQNGGVILTAIRSIASCISRFVIPTNGARRRVQGGSTVALQTSVGELECLTKGSFHQRLFRIFHYCISRFRFNVMVVIARHQ